GEVTVSDPRNVHTAGGVLLVADRARRQPGKVNYEPGRGAHAGFDRRPFALAVVLVVSTVVIPVGVAAVTVAFRVPTVPIPIPVPILPRTSLVALPIWSAALAVAATVAFPVIAPVAAVRPAVREAPRRV